jgi:hypothetical protein
VRLLLLLDEEDGVKLSSIPDSAPHLAFSGFSSLLFEPEPAPIASVLKISDQIKLFTGKPKPNIPVDPVDNTVVFVSSIAAKYWSPNDRPATETASVPMVPEACVPVMESP